MSKFLYIRPVTYDNDEKKWVKDPNEEEILLNMDYIRSIELLAVFPEPDGRTVFSVRHVDYLQPIVCRIYEEKTNWFLDFYADKI